MNKYALIENLSVLRGYPVTESTFYRWLKACGIKPQKLEDYSQIDVQRLQALVLWLSTGKTVSSFRKKLIEEMKKDAATHNHRATRTVESWAVEV